MRFFVILFFAFGAMACQQSPNIQTLIKAHNEQMEAAYRNNKPMELAAIYHDDGHLIAPGGYHVSGRKAIDEYWTRIADPVDWQLEVKLVTENEEALFSHPLWEELEEKPPHWDEFDIELPTDEKLVYELGRSTLQYKRADTVATSVVDFVLVWAEESAGTYKILLDTYH